MNTSPTIDLIATALAKAQGMLKPAIKDATNPAYRSRYADLAAIWSAIREALPQCELAMVQDVTMDDNKVSVTTLLTHSSGQWIAFGPLAVPMARPDAHGIGSAATYARRYSAAAAVGVVAEDEDDDGNAAVGKASGDTEALKPKRKGQAEAVATESPSSQLIAEVRSLYTGLKLKSDYGKRLMEQYTGGKTLDQASKAQVESLKAVLMKMKDKSPPASPEVIPAHRTHKIVDPTTGEVQMTAGVTLPQIMSIRELEDKCPEKAVSFSDIFVKLTGKTDWRDLTEESAETYAALLIEALK